MRITINPVYIMAHLYFTFDEAYKYIYNIRCGGHKDEEGAPGCTKMVLQVAFQGHLQEG